MFYAGRSQGSDRGLRALSVPCLFKENIYRRMNMFSHLHGSIGHELGHFNALHHDTDTKLGYASMLLDSYV